MPINKKFQTGVLLSLVGLLTAAIAVSAQSAESPTMMDRLVGAWKPDLIRENAQRYRQGLEIFGTLTPDGDVSYTRTEVNDGGGVSPFYLLTKAVLKTGQCGDAPFDQRVVDKFRDDNGTVVMAVEDGKTAFCRTIKSLSAEKLVFKNASWGHYQRPGADDRAEKLKAVWKTSYADLTLGHL